ncbi:NAD(P)H-dependent glycerol-3-phosphate dehydrogenase [Liberiplasma polymorphum]|uniref:NAD(P)H-dependent glycerol-3-phosphate dehydrogenase n=1 Tax=Liberiplasma polymorphum TaxID=3374570 RepID=UPI003770E511
MKITVIGGGSWGLGLSKVLADNNHDVLVYDVNEKIVDKINTLHVCIQLNEYIPESIKATTNIKEAIEFSNILLFVVPTKVLRIAINDALPYIKEKKIIINAAKGIEPETFKRISEIFTEMVPTEYLEGYVALSGPSHAEEVIKGMTTLITSASENKALALKIQELFHNTDYFRVYSSTDLIGAELGGALKNIFALASGLLRGQGLGDNASAALMTRGLVEMGKIYEHFGASKESLSGLTGVGDLIVTCTSPHSRNYQAGYKIGTGKDLNETLDSMTMVVEGIRTCEAAYDLSRKNGLDTPIIDAIYDVVFNRVEPKIAYQKLLARDQKSE